MSIKNNRQDRDAIGKYLGGDMYTEIMKYGLPNDECDCCGCAPFKKQKPKNTWNRIIETLKNKTN